jgi:hypothetical protein
MESRRAFRPHPESATATGADGCPAQTRTARRDGLDP